MIEIRKNLLYDLISECHNRVTIGSLLPIISGHLGKVKLRFQSIFISHSF